VARRREQPPAQARAVPRARGGLGRTLLRVVVLLGVGFVVLTAVPVLALRWCDPPTSAFMLEARAAAARAHQPYRTLYHWVALEHISPEAQLAVIASEDQGFPFHWGFDVRSIRNALRSGASGGRMRGASTISQQVAKNLFLWPGRSLVRKALEAWLTVLIEVSWPKRRILQTYLNVIELGRGIYGVQAAAGQYFHEPAARLSREQAALLAAVLPSPRRMHPDRPSAYVLERRDWILGQMRRLGGRAYLANLR